MRDQSLFLTCPDGHYIEGDQCLPCTLDATSAQARNACNVPPTNTQYVVMAVMALLCLGLLVPAFAKVAMDCRAMSWRNLKMFYIMSLFPVLIMFGEYLNFGFGKEDSLIKLQCLVSVPMKQFALGAIYLIILGETYLQISKYNAAMYSFIIHLTFTTGIYLYERNPNNEESTPSRYIRKSNFIAGIYFCRNDMSTHVLGDLANIMILLFLKSKSFLSGKYENDKERFTDIQLLFVNCNIKLMATKMLALILFSRAMDSDLASDSFSFIDVGLVVGAIFLFYVSETHPIKNVQSLESQDVYHSETLVHDKFTSE